MSEYICKCGEKKNLTKMTMKIVEGKVKTKEALCQCGKYMEELDKEFKGFPSLIRTEPTLNKKS